MRMLFVALLLAACSPATPDVTEPVAEPPPQPTTVEATTVEATPQVASRENPASVGATALLEDWEVTITSVDADGADRIDPGYAGNGPPDPDRRYIYWEVEATYTGEGSGDITFDLDWLVVGGKGNTFDFSDRCGAIDGQLASANEVFTGGTVSGPVCRKIPEDQVDGATILLDERFLDYWTFFEVP